MNKLFTHIVMSLTVVTLVVAGTATGAGAAAVRHLDNGINATIYAPGEGNLTVATTAGTALVPFTLAYVEQALADMADIGHSVDVDVYILDAVPTRAGGSFASRNSIYLSPGTALVEESTVAYITTHEMGHVLTWAFLDGHPQRWDAYYRLRGLDPTASGADAAHANRVREILAEDIRFLFGGAAATRSNSIENHDLVLPNRVLGLKEMLREFFATGGSTSRRAVGMAYPNPFNPMTNISMAVDSGTALDPSQAVLRVFDVRGALVRTVRGGVLANDRISLRWNGTTDAGTNAPSGRYLYLLKLGPVTADGALTLVR